LTGLSIVSCGIRNAPPARLIPGPCTVSGLTSPSVRLPLLSASTDPLPVHRCDGKFDQFCDPSREENDITGLLQNQGQGALLSFMQTYWKDNGGEDNSFWAHEWNKHGTCMRYAKGYFISHWEYIFDTSVFPLIAHSAPIASAILSRLPCITLPRL
jgi:hypothetical protein